MDPREADRLPIAKYVLALLEYRRFIGVFTVIAILCAVGVGTWYYVSQPTRWIGTLEFRPVFQGAEFGRYPNNLKFAPSDITDASIADEVYEANHLADLCSRDSFRSSFVVEQSSAALRFLELDYQAKLSDPRLSPVERQRLQDEYNAKRQTTAQQYQLAFVRPPDCSRLSATLVSKLMLDTLQTWAVESETRRGVLRIRVPVLTPDVFDSVPVGSEPLLVRADLIRTAINRLIQNVTDVERVEGSAVVRLKDNTTFSQLRARYEDLVQARLDPLVATAGISRDSLAWVQESLRVATMQRDAAQQRADAILLALREYSGTQTTTAPTSAGKGQSEAPSMTTVLDKSFIDKIVELSTNNTGYRQQLTRDLVSASVDAVKYKTVVQHYQSLLDSLNRGSGAPALSAADVTRRLDEIVQEAKSTTVRFNQLYEEFSRSALRPAGQMYQIEQPMQIETIQTFGPRNFLVLVAVVAVLAPIVLALLSLAHFRLRQLAGDAMAPPRVPVSRVDG